MAARGARAVTVVRASYCSSSRRSCVVRRMPGLGDAACAAAGTRARSAAPLLVGAADRAALTFVGWWATAVHTPLWVRHPAPGLLAFVPVLFAFVVPALVVLWRAGAWAAGRAARRRGALRSAGDHWLLRGSGRARRGAGHRRAGDAGRVGARRTGIRRRGARASACGRRRDRHNTTRSGSPPSGAAPSAWSSSRAPTWRSSTRRPRTSRATRVLSTDPAACERPFVSAPPFVVCAR